MAAVSPLASILDHGGSRQVHIREKQRKRQTQVEARQWENGGYNTRAAWSSQLDRGGSGWVAWDWPPGGLGLIMGCWRGRHRAAGSEN